MPRAALLRRAGRELPAAARRRATSPTPSTRSRIKRGMRYQPHPGVRRGMRTGKPLYHDLTARRARGRYTLRRFQGDRDARAERARLRVPDQAARAPAAALADPRPHGRLHRRPEGVRRDQLQAAATGAAASGQARLARSHALPARRRRGGRRLHLPRQAEGPVSAVPVLARDAVLRAGAARSRPLLRAARDGGEEPHARLVPDRHRSLHARR